MRESAASDPIRIFFLRNLSSSGAGTAKYQAQNILCFFYNECDPYYFDTGETRASTKQIQLTNNGYKTLTNLSESHKKLGND